MRTHGLQCRFWSVKMYTILIVVSLIGYSSESITSQQVGTMPLATCQQVAASLTRTRKVMNSDYAFIEVQTATCVYKGN